VAIVRGAGARVVFSDSAVASITGLPSGEVYQYVQKGGRTIARNARLMAPTRTGRLKRSISSRVTRANATSTRVRVICSVPYAAAVHDGTGGPGKVYRQPGGYLLYTKPYNPGGAIASGHAFWINRRIDAFHGQEASPFLLKAFYDWALGEGFRTGGIKVGVV